MSAARRLKTRDYSSPGLYFVTVCTNFKCCTFGKVVKGKVELSPLGKIAKAAWIGLSDRAGMRSQCHVVMPNHVHGILEILSKDAQQTAPLQGKAPSEARVSGVPALSLLVRSFKAEVTRRARTELNWTDEIWQHNFFDRVIRDGREFSNAMRYVSENPIRWEGQKKRWAEDEARKRKIAQQAAQLHRDRI